MTETLIELPASLRIEVRESEKAIMVPQRDRIDVWWNLATVHGEPATRTDKTSASFPLTEPTTL